MTTIKELMNLSGRRALITGANGSLGRIFSESLAELGADLVLVDLEGSDLELFRELKLKSLVVTLKFKASDQSW